MEHQPVDSSFAWGKFVMRADLPKTTKDIALAMIMWGDFDGSNVRPGNRILAAAFDIEERSVREHLKILRDLGLIEKVGFGRTGGGADTYRLTTPGAGHLAVPMLMDPHWQRLTPRGTGRARTLTSIRKAAAEARKAAAAAAEQTPDVTPLPAMGHLVDTAASGTWVPEDEPVDNPGYRHPGAGSESVDNSPYRHTGAGTDEPAEGPYRHPGAELPAPGCRSTGTRVPPTTQTTQDHPTNPSGSSQVGTSPEPETIKDAEPAIRIVRGAAALAPDPDAYAAAHAFVSALPDFGEFFQAAALRDFRAEGVPDPSIPALIVRAAAIAARPDAETRSA